jgi:hypothetical protein
MPPPPKPSGLLDEACFMKCLVFGKAALTAANTVLLNKAASAAAGSRLAGAAGAVRAFGNNPGTMAIFGLYGMDYCWQNCRKDPNMCTDYQPFTPTGFFPGGA